ncbi:MAG TPA: hypothetical protein DIT49_01460 [Clostridiales bacterium]|nr:hypothetical protein [Clostridiales bacterium]
MVYPAAVRMAAVMAAVEPLPLVPTMWMNLSARSGWPSRSSRAQVRDRPGRLPSQDVLWM